MTHQISVFILLNEYLTFLAYISFILVFLLKLKQMFTATYNAQSTESGVMTYINMRHSIAGVFLCSYI